MHKTIGEPLLKLCDVQPKARTERKREEECMSIKRSKEKYYVEGIELDMENWTQWNEHTKKKENEFGFKRTENNRKKKLPHELCAVQSAFVLFHRGYILFKKKKKRNIVHLLHLSNKHEKTRINTIKKVSNKNVSPNKNQFH